MSNISDKNARIEAICYMQKYIELVHPYWEEVAVIIIKFFIVILNEAERIEETTSHSIGDEWGEFTHSTCKRIYKRAHTIPTQVHIYTTFIILAAYFNDLLSTVPELILTIIRNLLQTLIIGQIDQIVLNKYKMIVRFFVFVVTGISLIFSFNISNISNIANLD